MGTSSVGGAGTNSGFSTTQPVSLRRRLSGSIVTDDVVPNEALRHDGRTYCAADTSDGERQRGIPRHARIDVSDPSRGGEHRRFDARMLRCSEYSQHKYSSGKMLVTEETAQASAAGPLRRFPSRASARDGSRVGRGWHPKYGPLEQRSIAASGRTAHLNPNNFVFLYREEARRTATIMYRLVESGVVLILRTCHNTGITILTFEQGLPLA